MMENSSFTFSSKKLLYFSIPFVGIFIIANIYFISVLPVYDYNYSIVESYKKHPALPGNYDILFLGDSRTNQGVDPRHFDKIYSQLSMADIKSYNLGRPSLQIPFLYYVLADYLRNNKPPKYVALQMSYFFLGGIKKMEDIYFTYYDPHLVEVIEARFAKLRNTKQSLKWFIQPKIPLWSFRNRFQNMFFECLRDFESMNTYIKSQYNSVADLRNLILDGQYLGYHPRFDEVVDEKTIKDEGFKVGYENSYTLYFKYLSKLMSLAEEHNFTIYFYDYPWPAPRESHDQWRKVTDHYMQFFKEKMSKSKNVHFNDKILFYETKLFADDLHLNHSGAVKLTEQLAHWIAKHKKESK